MTKKDIEEMGKSLMEKSEAYILLIRDKRGYSTSYRASADEIYNFLQVLIESDGDLLDIMREVVESRKKPKGKPKEITYYN